MDIVGLFLSRIKNLVYVMVDNDVRYTQMFISLLQSSSNVNVLHGNVAVTI